MSWFNIKLPPPAHACCGHQKGSGDPDGLVTPGGVQY